MHLARIGRSATPYDLGRPVQTQSVPVIPSKDDLTADGVGGHQRRRMRYGQTPVRSLPRRMHAVLRAPLWNAGLGYPDNGENGLHHLVAGHVVDHVPGALDDLQGAA